MNDLIVIAHPDDEIIWFSSILFRNNPDIICVTGGRDENDKNYRLDSFINAMNILGIKNYYFLDFPDSNQRLDIVELEKALNPFVSQAQRNVYTHGPYGEIFNHIHHQDVSYIVHKLFKKVYSVAWNIFPDIVNTFSIQEYDLKKYLLGTIYSREYAILYDSYRITSSEEFVELDFQSIEVYYWAIANFGDHHELLSENHKDFWGFADSPYELERHAAIVVLAKKTSAQNILEFAACEGILTDLLSDFAKVDCTEKANKYKNILLSKGYSVVDNPQTINYDLSILASFLEYLDDPNIFLQNMESRYLIIDVILDSKLDFQMETILENYKKIEEFFIEGRWERMFHDSSKAKLPVYKLGSHCALYEKNNHLK